MVTFAELPHDCEECGKTFLGNSACPRCGWDEKEMTFVPIQARTTSAQEGESSTTVLVFEG